VPLTSKPGLPALPAICLYSETEIGASPSSVYLVYLSITTALAGKLTPAASVGVAATNLIAPERKASSTSSRASLVSPAWWKAAPLSTIFAKTSPSSPSTSILTLSAHSLVTLSGFNNFDIFFAAFSALFLVLAK